MFVEVEIRLGRSSKIDVEATSSIQPTKKQYCISSLHQFSARVSCVVYVKESKQSTANVEAIPASLITECMLERHRIHNLTISYPVYARVLSNTLTAKRSNMVLFTALH